MIGVDNIWMGPGAKVLYLGAASGTTVSHVSDIVGPTGVVYAVEFSHRPGRDLINMAKLRTNVIPIVEVRLSTHPPAWPAARSSSRKYTKRAYKRRR